MTTLSALLLAALTVAPSDRMAMADRLFNRGDYAQAKKEYAALEGVTGIAVDRLAFRRLYCAYQLGDKASVRKDGEAFLKKYPGSDDANQVRFLRAMSASGPTLVNELKALDTDTTPASRRAVVLCKLGELTKDPVCLERCVKLDPKGEFANFAKYYHAVLLSESKNETDRRKATGEFLDLAFSKDRALGENALYSAACLTFSDKRYGEAVSLAKRYLKFFPDKRERVTKLRSIAAVSEYNAGRYSSAVEFCGDERGEQFDLIRTLALDRFGEHEKAQKLGREYLERYPATAGRRQVELLLARAELAAAEKTSDPRKLVESARRTAEISGAAADRVRYGWMLEKAGETEKAEGVYVAVARDFPGTPEAADALYRRGLSLARRGQWSPAELSFAEALSAGLDGERRGHALYWRGVACLRLDHAAEGAKHLKEALAAKLPPDETREARLMLADIDFNAGRREAAVREYAELVRLGAADRMSAAKVLAVGELLGPEEAKLCAGALVKSASAEWRQAGYALLGDSEEDLGNAVAAAAAREKALAEKCTTEAAAGASLKLGLYRLAAGEIEKAEVCLKKAVELNRQNGEARAQAYLGLAKAALSRKDGEAAKGYATVVQTLFEKSAAAVEAGAILRRADR